MLIVGSALEGYAIEASDGPIGTVKTFLFDDTTWKVRWLVIDTGNWLSGRQVLVHPSAIGTPDHGRQHLPVRLSKAQVEASPDIEQDRPVTMQMQRDLYGYYGWDPYWGPNFYGPAGFGIEPSAFSNRGQPYPGEGAVLEAETMQMQGAPPWSIRTTTTCSSASAAPPRTWPLQGTVVISQPDAHRLHAAKSLTRWSAFVGQEFWRVK